MNQDFTPSLTCSVIINTYNRAPYLRRLLAGLGHLRAVVFEVVVVNGPSTDETDELLKEYADRIKVAKCPTRNLSQSRNLGIAASAGDVLVFIDDDALPTDVDWLTRFVAAFQVTDASAVGALGGPVINGDTEHRAFDGGATSDYGVQVFHGAHEGTVTLDPKRWTLGVPGGNCAFRRAAITRIGGFDEFYTYYLDETDVCLRLARADWSTRYIADNPVRHYSAPAAHRQGRFLRNWHEISRSDTYFALKNGSDPLPERLFRTLALAPHKHFFKEINEPYSQGHVSSLLWLRSILRWLRGLLGGLWGGLLRRRRLADFTAPPLPLLPFKTSRDGKKLRIALLTQTIPLQSSYGGIGRYTYDLACGLHERGHEVHIFCKDEKPIRYERLEFVIHGIPGAGYQGQRLFSGKPVLQKNVSYGLAVVQKLAELYGHGLEFDVVHAPNWDAEGAALIRAQLYPVTLVLATSLAQTVIAEQWEYTDDLKACVALDRWQIEHADVVCTPSRGVLGSYDQLMGLSPQLLSTVRVAPQGIVPSVARTRRPGSGRYRLLFVGRLERRKGIHVLLDVLPDLLAACPNWECHLVGDDQIRALDGDTYKDRFLRQHMGASWLKRVLFHGLVSETELSRHYEGCDLFVAPSLYESYGLIYHEAMQYGKAVVGCRTGGVPEVVEHGSEGLLVEPDNAPALKAALRQLIDDSALRQRLGQAGARRVHQFANYRTMAAHMEQAYEEAIRKVGSLRQARRRQCLPRKLSLLNGSNELKFDGPWEIREAAPGQTYRLGLPNAALEFTASGDSGLKLVCLKHPWSGILQVQVNDQVFRYLDLHYPGASQLNSAVWVALPGKPSESIKIGLRVHPEHNPEALGSEVWLKEIWTLNKIASSQFGEQNGARLKSVP